MNEFKIDRTCSSDGNKIITRGTSQKEANWESEMDMGE
jgi:hypothetical protein